MIGPGASGATVCPCSTANSPPLGSRSPTSATSTCSPMSSSSTASLCPRQGWCWSSIGWAASTARAAGARLHRRPRRQGRAGRPTRGCGSWSSRSPRPIGAQVVWVMGNHDERAPYAEGLFDVATTTAPQDPVYDVGGLRIVALDTSVPRYHHGELSHDAARLARATCWPRRPSTAPSSRCTTRRSRCRCCQPARSSSCSARTGSPRCWRAATCGRSLAGTSTTRRTRPSPASRSRWPRRAATPPTRRPWTG